MVICLEMADLSALLYVMLSCVFVTIQYGVEGQVWYFIVWIPDLRLHLYSYLMHTYAKFDQNRLCVSRVMIIFTNW